MRDQPEYRGKNNAQNNAGHDRKINRPVLTLPGDIAGQSAQAKWQSATVEEKRAYNEQYATKQQKRPPDFAHRVHVRENQKRLE